MYVREQNKGSLGTLLDGLDLDEEYLLDTNNWVSHGFLHVLYHRMIAILGDENGVYKLALASGRFQSLGLLDGLARLVGSPKLIYTQAPKYNRLLKLNGEVYIHELGDSWVVLEDRYHEAPRRPAMIATTHEAFSRVYPRCSTWLPAQRGGDRMPGGP